MAHTRKSICTKPYQTLCRVHIGPHRHSHAYLVLVPSVLYSLAYLAVTCVQQELVVWVWWAVTLTLSTQRVVQGGRVKAGIVQRGG